MSDPRIIMVFDEPPAKFNFAQAKSGKCWWCRVDNLEAAWPIINALKRLSIKGVVRKDKPRRNSRLPYPPRDDGINARRQIRSP